MLKDLLSYMTNDYKVIGSKIVILTSELRKGAQEIYLKITNQTNTQLQTCL